MVALTFVQSVRQSTTMSHAVATAILLLSAILLRGPADPSIAAQALYWCPDRPADQQYTAAPQAGCRPLVSEEDKQGLESKGKRFAITVENMQSETMAFLRRYRVFLGCCALHEDGLEQAVRLEDEASAILLAAQEGLFSEQMKLRGFTYRELLPPVARAREELRQLRSRLRDLTDARQRLQTLDYEAAGRERRRIQEEEAGIAASARLMAPPEAPRTGTEISDTSLPNRVGTQAGDVPENEYNRIGERIGNTTLAPRQGHHGSGTTLPNRTGTDASDTTLRNPTGFEAGTTDGPTGESTTPMRVGPAIGDSPLNSHRSGTPQH